MAPAQPSPEQLVNALRYARPTVLQILRTVPDDVDDVLQDAAFNVLRTRAFKGQSTFNSYFTRCAINTALMHLRKRRVTVVSIDTVMAMEDGSGIVPDMLVSRERSPLEQVEMAEKAKRLWRAIGRLAPGQRDGALRIMEGEMTSSAADKSRRFQARRRLRVMLERGGMRHG